MKIDEPQQSHEEWLRSRSADMQAEFILYADQNPMTHDVAASMAYALAHILQEATASGSLGRLVPLVK